MDIGEAHRHWRPAEDQRRRGQHDRPDVGRSLKAEGRRANHHCGEMLSLAVLGLPGCYYYYYYYYYTLGRFIPEVLEKKMKKN